MHIGERDVVLRVIRHFPDIAGIGGVEHQLVPEKSAQPPRCRLDPSARGGHLRVIAIIAHTAMMAGECSKHTRCHCYPWTATPEGRTHASGSDVSADRARRRPRR